MAKSFSAAARSAPPSPEPELLTVDQVAARLSISARTVWELARAGDLRPVRVRRCTRWRRSDVLAYAAGLPAGGGHAS